MRTALVILAVLFLLSANQALGAVPHYSIISLSGASVSQFNGINNSGQVVGINSNGHAFLSSGGTMLDLGTFGGTFSWAYGINNSGEVVGMAETSGSFYHAFSYSGGSIQDLGTLGGTNGGSANGINDNGQIVGDAYTSGNAAYHAFLYSGGSMHDLGTLGGVNSVAQGHQPERADRRGCLYQQRH